MTAPQQTLDGYGTITTDLYDPATMRVRNAILELLRAWEDLNNLPRAVPNKFEREGIKPDRGHHNR